MIEILSSWAKGLGVTIVIVSIFEMLLPNNNSKKYIRMVLGIYVIFNIISPLVKNKEVFSLDSLNLEEYQTVETTVVDQTSMDERIKELYEQELEKDTWVSKYVSTPKPIVFIVENDNRTQIYFNAITVANEFTFFV